MVVAPPLPLPPRALRRDPLPERLRRLSVRDAAGPTGVPFACLRRHVADYLFHPRCVLEVCGLCQGGLPGCSALVHAADVAARLVHALAEVRVLRLAYVLCLAGLFAQHHPQPLPDAAGCGERLRRLAERALSGAPEEAALDAARQVAQDGEGQADDLPRRVGRPHRKQQPPGDCARRGVRGHVRIRGVEPPQPTGAEEAAAGQRLAAGDRVAACAAADRHGLPFFDIGQRAEEARR
mmetsp:Transcript_36328/g.104599  ORF Transcript_36328/g.104599 Transcript_36328/m.104599 type:complete len:237 (-) Transcript_36328:1360-2070(-)